MKKFKIELSKEHTANPDQIVDGCLGNEFGNGKITLYDKEAAIKKAIMFGGEVKEVKGIHNLIGNMTIQTIPKKSLLASVIKALNGRECFEGVTDFDGERIYYGDVFGFILGENSQIKDNSVLKITNKEVLNQLEELNSLISADYVIIIGE